MTPRSHQTLLAAWIGILLAPAAWIVSFEIKYAAVPYACQSHSTLVLHSVSAVAMIIATAGLLAARRAWAATGKAAVTEESDPIHRDSFLGMFGLLFSANVLLLMLAQWIPVFLLDPCAH